MSWSWHPAHVPEGSDVVLCMAGQVRSLIYDWMLDHWRVTVLEPLRATIVMHVSTEWHFQSRAVEPVTMRQLIHVIRKLRPLSVNVVDDEKLGLPTNLDFALPGSRLSARWAGCAADIERAETELARSFKWVLRTRPDVMWLCRLPQATYWPSRQKRLALMFEDYSVLLTRDIALAVLRLQSRYRAHEQGNPCGIAVRQHTKCLDSLLSELNATACDFASPWIQRRVLCHDSKKLIVVNGIEIKPLLCAGRSMLGQASCHADAYNASTEAQAFMLNRSARACEMAHRIESCPVFRGAEAVCNRYYRPKEWRSGIFPRDGGQSPYGVEEAASPQQM